MKNIIILMLLFFCVQVFSQQQIKDSIFILYNGDTKLINIIKDKGTDVRHFSILWYSYLTKKSREKRLKYLRAHGGGETGFYFGFQGVRNFIVNGNIDNYELNTVEEISKRKILWNSNTKIFFIEKLDCNKYKFHQTHRGYD